MDDDGPTDWRDLVGCGMFLVSIIGVGFLIYGVHRELVMAMAFVTEIIMRVRGTVVEEPRWAILIGALILVVSGTTVHMIYKLRPK